MGEVQPRGLVHSGLLLDVDAGGAAVFMELRDGTGGVGPAVGDHEGQEGLKQGDDSDHAGEELRRVGRDNEGVVGQQGSRGGATVGHRHDRGAALCRQPSRLDDLHAIGGEGHRDQDVVYAHP
ncbi:MAG: hypothetical protein CL464_10145 [Acidimicrobiaceae bacterium]|nr:hypothetical protein [Acidimicrobiaceae bacterium]